MVNYALFRLLQDDINMMWEPNVVAAQVEPYVTDYGIDTVSGDRGTPVSIWPKKLTTVTRIDCSRRS